MHDDKDLHLTCSCHGHDLRFARDDDDLMWYISLWERRHGNGYSWRNRLRHIWFILRKGHPFVDEIVLETPQLLELQEYVNAQLEKKISNALFTIGVL